MSSGIKKYTLLQFNQFINNLLISVNPDNEGSIHDYRVAAKRMHTINRLIKSMNKRVEFSRYFECSGIKQSFKAGGELRETSINISMLRESEISLEQDFSQLNKFLNQKKKRAEKEFNTMWDHFPYDTFFEFKTEVINFMINLSPGRFDQGYKQFVRSKMAEVKSLINSGELDNKMHRARKIIKNIKYIYELVSEPGMRFGNKRISLNQLTLLEDRIGKWHDWLMFSSDIKLFIEGMKMNGKVPDLKYYNLFKVVEKNLSGIQMNTGKAITRLFQNVPEKS
jgi:CHAD domain-containing protein